MKNIPIETQYGIIKGRDALIIDSIETDLRNLTVVTALLLSFCYLPNGEKKYDKSERDKEVYLQFKFSDIKRMSIIELEESFKDSNYDDLGTKSCFEQILGEDRYILSTYDDVFDIHGKCEITYL